MQNLNPSRIIARRGRDLMVIGALLLLVGMLAISFGFFVLLLFSTQLLGLIIILIGIAAFLAGIGFMVRGLTLRTENIPAAQVAEVLAQVLDAQYTFIRNVSRRGLGYIDAVLIGPAGALVFRIHDKPGDYLNEGGDWLERKPGKPYVLTNLNLTREVVNDVHALRKYFAERKLGHVPVFALVVFTHPNALITARQPRVPIAQLNTLIVVLKGDFLRAVRIDAPTVKAAVAAIYQ
jgi:hypothetical protein